MSYAEKLIAPQAAPRAVAKPMTAARLTGYILVAFWALLAAFLILTVIKGWDPDKFTRYGPRYLHGLWITLSIVALSVVFGAVLSLPLAMARMSGNRVLNWLAYGYIYFFRGTPLLAQLFLVYYGLGIFRPQLEAVGIWWFFRDAWYCGLFAMTINTAAYQAEILRGAIESVSHGQHEAAAALGIHKFIAFRKIILPQALIVALRPYGNEIILLIGETAEVGDDCTIYQGVTLGGTSLHAGAKRHPTLERGVIIGAGAKVLGGFTVGEYAKVGSNAVVLKPVPAGATAVGNPAHLVQKEHAPSPSSRFFSAYGVTANGDDPLSKALHSLITHAVAQEEQIERLSAAMKAAGLSCPDIKACDKLDQAELNKLVE